MKKLVVMSLLTLWLNIGRAEQTAQPSEVATFFKTHGLVFFFESTCPYCHQFSPVLSRVSKELEASVLPLSFDNQPLPEFQDVQPATSEWTTAAFHNEAIHYPALFIVNPDKETLYAVSIGALNEMELNIRLAAMIPKIIRFEQGAA